MPLHFHNIARRGGVFLLAMVAGFGCAQRQATATRRPAATVAGALYAAELEMGTRGKTLRTIAMARQIVVDDLLHADTTGYKRRIATVNPAGQEPRVALDLAQGSLERTDRTLDLAIHGEGFFAVRWPRSSAGIAYTRSGNLFTDASGQLILGLLGADDNCPLATPIHIPKDATDITIAESGEVTVLLPGQAVPQRIGAVELTRFQHPDALALAHEGGIYVATPDSGGASVCQPGEASAGKVLQGFLEQSNVDPVVEQIRLDFLKRWEAALLSVDK